MEFKASSLLFLALFSIFSATAMAFNITKILSSYPDYTTFNDLLSQTGLAQQINSRQTITVLAVNDSAMGGVSGKPLDIVKRILSVHVVLDYYDETKLEKLQNKSSILTTLYQTTGTADHQQGFLNVTKTPKGIMFASAANGSPLTVSLQGSITSQPYNISVLQVSGIIEAQGIENMAPPPPGSKKAPAPSPTPGSKKAPAPSPTPAKAPSPAAAPTPASVGAPDADASVSSPPEPNSASTPADDSPAAAPSHSASSRLHAGGVAASAMGLVACMMMAL